MLKIRTICTILFCILCSAGISAAQQPELTLVYKDSGKPPYMEVAPDSSGLYYDLISRATQNIGFDLQVLRMPKKRTYQLLERGEADLYASAEFKDFRSKFLFYMPNGLYRHEDYWGMTKQSIPQLHSISEIKEYGLRWVFELGSSWPRKAADYDVPYVEQPTITIEQAIRSLQNDRPFFFQFISEDIDEYMKKNPTQSWDDLGVRIHKSCCESKTAPLYLAFSRQSPHFSEEPNPAYDKEKPLSVENFPTRLVPGTVPYRLQEALQEMIDSGEIEELAHKYFGENWKIIIH